MVPNTEVELHSNCQWAQTPSSCRFNPDFYSGRVEELAIAVKSVGASYIIDGFAKEDPDMVAYDEDGIEFDIDDQDYSILGMSLYVFNSGKARMVWKFKHTDDEIWSDDF